MESDSSRETCSGVSWEDEHLNMETLHSQDKEFQRSPRLSQQVKGYTRESHLCGLKLPGFCFVFRFLYLRERVRAGEQGRQAEGKGDKQTSH